MLPESVLLPLVAALLIVFVPLEPERIVMGVE